MNRGIAAACGPQTAPEPTGLAVHPRPRRQGRRRVATAAMALAGLVALLLPAAAEPPVPVLDWQPCAAPGQHGFDCATTQVPLDYGDPQGATLDLAVIRHPATDPDNRLGALFFNPGGPGIPGTGALPVVLDSFPAPLRARFDVISWDPRGVGASTAVQCFDTPDDRERFLAGLPEGFPVGRAEQRAWIEGYTRLGQRCGERHGDLLAHVSTAESAQDLDLLRQAMGDPQLTYQGNSYGTFLGATYTNLFPDRVRAMVLIGNVDPGAYTNGGEDDTLLNTSLRLGADKASAQVLDAFLDLCGQASTAQCAFSAGSAAATRAKWTTLLQRLREQPVTVGTPPRTFTYAALVSTMIGNLNRVPRWTPAAELLQTLWTSREPGAPLPAPDAAVSPPAQEIETHPEQQYAVLCAESPNPRPPGVFRALAALAYARAGDVGPFWAWLDEPCASWPATAAARYAGPWDRPTAHPILVINTTYDPATPYEGAVALANALARARLLTVDGYGHSLGGVPSACVSDAISRYVVDGTLPPEGTVCPQDQPPFTTSSGSTLPRNVVVPLSVVNEFFPDVTQEASTGQNAAAVGNPTATRSVIYATSDGSKKVTITVDQYGSASDASSAYQEAVQKSEMVPGFTPLPPPTVGQQASAGIVTMGAETHIGLGALDGTLFVAVTLAGYDATPDNIAQLVALARTEDAAAKMALGISYGAPNR